MTSFCRLQYPPWPQSIVDTAVKAGQFNAPAAAGKKTDAQKVQGEVVRVDATMGGVTLRNAKVVITDIAADKRVIHLIDKSRHGRP